MFRLRFSLFVSFFSFVKTTSFISSCNTNMRQYMHNMSLFLVFHFFNTIVQLIVIDKKKHGNRRNEFDSKKGEDRQNGFVET